MKKLVGLIGALALALALAPTTSAASAPHRPSVSDAQETCVGITIDDVIGPAPAIAAGRTLETFPNDDAVCEAVWVPTLDDGFNPRGFALLGDGTALVSGWYEEEILGGAPLVMRIVHVDLSDGSLLDLRDIPNVGEGTGIQVDDAGRVWIASTNKLLTWASVDELFSSISPKKVTRGGVGYGMTYLADVDGPSLWVGSGPANKLIEFPLALLLDKANAPKASGRKLYLTEATSILATGKKTKGAAFTDSTLWTASSQHPLRECATLNVGIDTRTRYGFAPGIAEIEFDETGYLWVVSESGSVWWPTHFFPVIAKVDTTQIVEAPSIKCHVGT